MIYGIAFRGHPGNPEWSLTVLILIISAKTLFPNKVVFTGSRVQDLLLAFGGDHYSANHNNEKGGCELQNLPPGLAKETQFPESS